MVRVELLEILVPGRHGPAQGIEGQIGQLVPLRGGQLRLVRADKGAARGANDGQAMELLRVGRRQFFQEVAGLLIRCQGLARLVLLAVGFCQFQVEPAEKACVLPHLGSGRDE